MIEFFWNIGKFYMKNLENLHILTSGPLEAPVGFAAETLSVEVYNFVLCKLGPEQSSQIYI